MISQTARSKSILAINSTFKISPLRLLTHLEKLTGADDPNALKADHVILKATGITAEQITPGGSKQTMEWEITPQAAGQLDPTKPLQCKISRDAAQRFEVKIKKKNGGPTIFQMNVWVVWSTCVVTPGTAQFVPDPIVPRYLITPTAATVWRFKFKILPTEMLDPAITERPNLVGEANELHPPPGHKNLFVVEPSLGAADTAKIEMGRFSTTKGAHSQSRTHFQRFTSAGARAG